MLPQLRAIGWLVGLTLVLCCVVYPLTLLAIGQTIFPAQAEGSLLTGTDGKPAGSRLIAQPFGGDEYFWPRPSAASYNAAASGASNYGASNPLLRDRVARTLGPIVRYKGTSPTGKSVQEDVVEWFKSRPDIVAEWADGQPSSVQAWANADDKHKDAINEWAKKSPDAVAEWKKDNPGAGEPKPADLAVSYFKANAAAFHKQWPKWIDDSTWSVEAVFFDLWLQAHPEAALEQVPADLVTASGSGLDLDITLKGALYQLDRVAAAWAAKTKLPEAGIKTAITALLKEKAHAPLGGLVGEPLVNVLEVNLELPARVQRAARN